MGKKRWYLNVVLETNKIVNRGNRLSAIKINYAGKYYETKKELTDKIKQIKKMI